MHTLQKILKIYGIQYYEKRININNVHSSTSLSKSLRTFVLTMEYNTI